MKLRIRGNSLRLRLSRGEVAALGGGGRVEDATAFGPGAVLRWAVEVGPGDAVRARLDGPHITVTLPEAAARRWAASDDEVGLSGAQPAGEGGAELTIVVEKDFPCAGRSDAENADTFEVPGAGPRC